MTQNKINVGDKVLIEVEVTGVSDNEIQLKSRGWEDWTCKSKIKKVITAPFDWDIVEPRMAFKDIEGNVFWYVSKGWGDDRCAVFSTNYREPMERHLRFMIKENLTRAVNKDPETPDKTHTADEVHKILYKEFLYQFKGKKLTEVTYAEMKAWWLNKLLDYFPYEKTTPSISIAISDEGGIIVNFEGEGA
ncbi:MAG: hypothetical protein COB09_18975 [Thalassobium sp.]|nr:MAG: hypothetical protein COB09_18975 [Thalassobium sp.]